MVRKIESKSFWQKIKEQTGSPFFIPYIMLFFVMVTLPVVYLVSQTPLEIRQRAATITGGAIVIDTDETSFQQAASQIIPPSTLNIIISILILIAISSGILAVVLFRRRI